jgi:hypothetical protein
MTPNSSILFSLLPLKSTQLGIQALWLSLDRVVIQKEEIRLVQVEVRVERRLRRRWRRRERVQADYVISARDGDEPS